MSVTRGDRHRLEAIVSDRSAPQKHVWRANIILATAEGCGTAEIMRRSGKSKPVVWRWQARFMAEGVEGLTRDKTRKPGKQPLPTGTVQRVVDLALGPPPGEATYWTGRRTKIKSYVTEHKIRPVTTKEKIVVGGRVPADVELESVPADWGPSLPATATRHRLVPQSVNNRQRRWELSVSSWFSHGRQGAKVRTS